MADPKQPSSKADALANQLKDSLARRRPRPWKLVTAALIGSVATLIFVAWWLYPRPKPAPLQMIALDVLATTDEKPHALVQLLPPPGDETPRRLSNHTVLFHEPRLQMKPDQQPRVIEAKSDQRGQASVEWSAARPGLTEFLAIYKDEENGRGSPHELGRVFVWPKDGRLLIVDADETLIGDDLEPKASEALTKARKEGWHIVYLATASVKAHEFRTVRGWLAKHQAKLPVGPVLSRQHFDGEKTPAESRRDVLKKIRSQFAGPMLALVKTTETAQLGKEIGIRTIQIGTAETPSWAEMLIKLK